MFAGAVPVHCLVPMDAAAAAAAGVPPGVAAAPVVLLLPIAHGLFPAS